jgi:hypothetical protein
MAPDGTRLGERLARAVPGEWTGRQEGPVRVFLHPLDEPRRAAEARALAMPLADYILKDSTGSEIAAIVRRRYPGFDVADRGAVTVHALERYRAFGPEADSRRHAEVAGRLSELLLDCASVLVEGTICFRLPEWRDELEAAVDDAADLWILAREEQEFIRVLKAYRELEPPGPDSIHVLAEPGVRRVEDESGHPLERVEVHEEMGGDTRGGEELVAALVSLAPHHLTLHQGVGGAEARIVEGVFGRAAVRCTGCERCRRGELRPPG